MIDRPELDPGVGFDMAAHRTVDDRRASVSVVLPAHNEEDNVAQAVASAAASLRRLGVEGEVVVSASGCTDRTAEVAAAAGATVVTAPIGKGRAIEAGVRASTGDIVCLVDADLRYFGDPPLAALLADPILRGLADVTIADLHWRPVYPQLWFYGFFVPFGGRLFPELLPKVGTTPWSGQRAALRELWPPSLPDGYTSDLALLLHWNDLGVRMRPVIADDWTHPERPKPWLVEEDFNLLTQHAVDRGRLADPTPVREWFDRVYEFMARYRTGVNDPVAFERELLEMSVAAGARTGGHAVT